MITENTQKSPVKFCCEDCSYYTSNKSDYKKHINTAKHKRVTSNDTNIIKSHICHCGKEFKYRQGLWKHKLKCNQQPSGENEIKKDTINNDIVKEEEEKNNKYETLIMLLVKENQDFKQLIIDQNKKMMEMTENMGNNHHNTTNTNTNTNSHNKFNLNVFLNEKCKDAMSLTDFIKDMEISIEDFVETGELGFVDGLSRVLIERINNMDLYNRPLHCTDLKRETVYIKDAEKWEKDLNKEHLRKAVKGVAYKNDRMRPIWYKETPNVDVLGSENCDKFLKYSQAALGGYGKEETKSFEDKIMRNVLKEVTIDKHMKIE